MFSSAFAIPVTLPAEVILPAVVALAIVTASCGAPPARKSIPAPVDGVVSVLSWISSLPLTILNR
jgi:hypothetical protein